MMTKIRSFKIESTSHPWQDKLPAELQLLGCSRKTEHCDCQKKTLTPLDLLSEKKKSMSKYTYKIYI